MIRALRSATRFRALFLLLLLWIGLGHRQVYSQGDVPSQLLQLVNQVRAEHGLPPFQMNGSLVVAAQNQANFNAANGSYGHSGAGGTSPQDRATAAGYVGYVVENVVGGTDLSPQQGVTWWINSPVHFNTLITTRYSEAGTGYALNGRQRHYTLVVGRRTDAPPVAAGTSQPADPPAIVVPITLSQPRPDGSIVHRVETGQTLWAIAARYEVRLEELRLYNNLDEDDFIRPGEELTVRLAEGQAPPPTPTPPFSHIVRDGETLWTIAARYRLSLADLLWLNGVNEEAILQPGDELTIRLVEGAAPPPTPTPQLKHIVAEGDSLWSVAARYRLALDDLLAFNQLQATALLQIGQELWIRPQPTPTGTTGLAAAEPLPTRVPDTLAEQPGEAAPLPTLSLESVVVTPEGVVSALPANATAVPAPVNSPDETISPAPPVALILGIGLAVLAGILLLAGSRHG